MEDLYFDLLEECASRTDVRAIVVTGAGRGFCAGADMDWLKATGETGSSGSDLQTLRPQTLPLTIPKPIIAAINGPCVGVGLCQALMCDVRFVADDAKLSTAFARRGLIAEHGISWLLPRLVGTGRALDLLLSARIVLGDEAAAMGLANRALPHEQVLRHALEYAAELATSCSPTCMSTIKSQVWGDLERGVAEALHDADRLMVATFTSHDFSEGVASFREKRTPEFAGVGA